MPVFSFEYNSNISEVQNMRRRRAFHRVARGLEFKVVVNCQNCEKVYINSCPLIKNVYEINRRIIFAMRLLGIGLNGIIKFCAFMNLLRPIFQSFYDKVMKSIAIATSAVRDISIKKAGIQEKELSIQKGQTEGYSVRGRILTQKGIFVFVWYSFVDRLAYRQSA